MAAVACEQPALPIIPANQDLGRRQRHQIQRSTRDYATAMTEYVACIKSAREAAGGKSAPELTRKLLNQRYETAVREFNVVLTLFVKRVGPVASLGLGPVASRTPQTCISMASAGKTLAVDDSTVLFYQQFGGIYVNRLPQACPGLQRSGGDFGLKMMRSSARIEELCAGDQITLIRGTRAGSMCRLGPFRMLTKEQAAALLDSGRAPLDDGSVTVAPVQLPPEEGEGSKAEKQR